MKKKQTYNLHTPEISKRDIQSINNIVKKGWVSTSGKIIDNFSYKLKNLLKIKYCIPVNSGTSALHLSLLSLGIDHNHEVIVPTVSFIAPINAVKYVGADPIFFDCNEFLNIDEKKVLKFLKEETIHLNGLTVNKKTKKIIKAIIIVHVFGSCANMQKIISICKRYKIECIEDAAESFGSKILKDKYKNYFAGTIGKIGCYSFNGNKIITTGSGGAVVTNSKNIAKKIHYLSNQAKENNTDFIHNDIGYNYRMNSLSAALGISQLKSINKFINDKKNNYAKYLRNFKDIRGVNIITNPSYSKSNYWLTVIKIDTNYFNINLEQLISYLIKNKINVRRLWKLNHLQKKYKKCQYYEIVNAKTFYSQCLCLPSNPSLSENDINYISKKIIKYLFK